MTHTYTHNNPGRNAGDVFLWDIMV